LTYLPISPHLSPSLPISPHLSPSLPISQGLDFTAVFGGATNLVYAYAGQWMYFEMMTEMEAPADFPKAFLLPGPDHANWCINQ